MKYSGNISVQNINIKTLSNIEKAKKISYMPQIFNNINISVSKLVEHGRFPHCSKYRKISEIDLNKIEFALEKTNMTNFKHKNISTLSGGERQRAYLAMVLAQDTDIVMLDEPTNFLDINNQLEVISIIKEMKKMGKTIIVVMHDLQQAFSLADNIIFVDNGKILKIGTPKNIVSSCCLEKVFGLNLIYKEQEGYVYNYHLVQGDNYGKM